jgi:hypothetical protein
MKREPLIVNFFAGPGAGKSTLAARVFADLKMAGYEAELVPEFAKVLTWSGHQQALRDQLYVFAKQDHRLEVLREQPLDVVVVDSPLLNSLIYAPPSYYRSFKHLVLEVFNSYRNLNFLLRRGTAYSAIGRNETPEGAMAKCREIEALLTDEQVPYVALASPVNAADTVLSQLHDILRGRAKI